MATGNSSEVSSSSANKGTVDKKQADEIDTNCGAAAETSKPVESEEMKELLAHQIEISEWLDKINNRVFELEDKYLVETLHGNVIKGWEADGKLLPRVNKIVEDKDRLFTYSSVNAWASYPVFKEKRQLKVENKQRKQAKRATPSPSQYGKRQDKFDDFEDDENEYY